MNYYTDLPQFVSNSDLGKFRNMIFCISEMQGLQKIYDFGNLVDGKYTQPHFFNPSDNTLRDDGGRIINFEYHEVQHADKMVEALKNDDVLSAITKDGLFQYVFTRKAEPIDWLGDRVYLPMKMKADIYVRNRLLCDIKTTACTSLKAFIDSIFFFNYDRQAAVYMDLARVDKILYVGVSKVRNKQGKYEVFKFLIERGDKTYLSGLDKKNYLGYRYFNLVHKFKLPPFPIAE